MNVLEPVKKLFGIDSADPRKAERDRLPTADDVAAAQAEFRKRCEEQKIAEAAVSAGDKSPAYLERFKHAVHVASQRLGAIRAEHLSRRDLAPPELIDNKRRIHKELVAATTQRTQLQQTAIPEADRELRIKREAYDVAKRAHAMPNRDKFSVNESGRLLERAESNLRFAERERARLTEEIDELAGEIFELEQADAAALKKLLTV